MAFSGADKQVSEPKDFVHCLHVGLNTETGGLMVVRNADQFSEELENQILGLSMTAGASSPKEPDPTPKEDLQSQNQWRSIKQLFERKTERKGSKEGERRKLSKEDIGEPTNFQHVTSSSGSVPVSEVKEEEDVYDGCAYEVIPILDDTTEHPKLPTPLIPCTASPQKPTYPPVFNLSEPPPAPDQPPRPRPRRSKSNSEANRDVAMKEDGADEDIYESMENLHN